MGRTLGEALRRTRALPIKRLLAETSLTLEEIAERTGFHSAQHLSEFFRDLEGCRELTAADGAAAMWSEAGAGFAWRSLPHRLQAAAVASF